jgi:glycosyltransferase involved in cell wall biosynthesis
VRLEFLVSDVRVAVPVAPLSIMHCLRAPVGGLFRHVADLAMAQAAAGHRVGVICAQGGDALTEARLRTLTPVLKLGVHRLEMGRGLGLDDITASRQVAALARDVKPDVLHGHGAKGGAYARLAARSLNVKVQAVRCFYTPHGGSLHYPPTTLAGKVYGALERYLERYTDGLLFESQFAADRYSAQIGVPACAARVVVNGLLPADFVNVTPRDDAADFLFVGELRQLKGVDVALEALAELIKQRPARAVFVGAGPDALTFKAQAESLGLAQCVNFPGTLPAREAFTMGRVLLVPSRAESLPYVVLEAIGAGLPVLASNVGGIPAIVPPALGRLLPPGDVAALASAMRGALENPAALQTEAQALKGYVQQRFHVHAMAGAITSFYPAPARLLRAA